MIPAILTVSALGEGCRVVVSPVAAINSWPQPLGHCAKSKSDRESGRAGFLFASKAKKLLRARLSSFRFCDETLLEPQLMPPEPKVPPSLHCKNKCPCPRSLRHFAADKRYQNRTQTKSRFIVFTRFMFTNKYIYIYIYILVSKYLQLQWRQKLSNIPNHPILLAHRNALLSQNRIRHGAMKLNIRQSCAMHICFASKV